MTMRIAAAALLVLAALPALATITLEDGNVEDLNTWTGKQEKEKKIIAAAFLSFPPC